MKWVREGAAEEEEEEGYVRHRLAIKKSEWVGEIGSLGERDCAHQEGGEPVGGGMLRRSNAEPSYGTGGGLALLGVGAQRQQTQQTHQIQQTQR